MAYTSSGNWAGACDAYSELCPVCGHTKDYAGNYHTGPNGQCMAIIADTGDPCGCAFYVTVPEGQAPAPTSELSGS